MSNKKVEKILVERVVKAIEEGKTLPWLKPWRDVEFVNPKTGRKFPTVFNRISGRGYGGYNRWILCHEGEYGTYKDWKKVNPDAKPLKGKSEMVFGWFRKNYSITEKDADTGEEVTEEKQHWYMKYWRVWHVSNVEGVEPMTLNRVKGEELTDDKISTIEDTLNAYYGREGISYVEDGESSAYYAPMLDRVHLPEKRQFKGIGFYYGTKFHETVHSTGHEKRLTAGIKRNPRNSVGVSIARKSLLRKWDRRCC